MPARQRPESNEQTAPANLRELLRQRVAASPAKTFLFSETDERRYTYAEFEAAVLRCGAMLAAHGIRKGDVVSLLLPNSAEYIIGYFACWSLGALAGPVNSLLKAEEIAYVMSNSEAKAILVHADFLPTVENIRSNLPNLNAIIRFDDEAEATKNSSAQLASY